jgi:hypothetical protein
VADYYSILSKAVSALEPNTASARQRLYERARSAMSAEIEGASPPFDASGIAAVKHGLRSAIERIEAEALPAWLKQERAECTNHCSATADLLPVQGGYRFLDTSEIAAAKLGLEYAMESIEAEAIPDRTWQAEAAARANDCPATADLPPEIEGASPDGSEIAAAMQRLESAIEKIKAEAIPALPQQPENLVCANDTATADVPAEIEETCPPFDASEIVANQGLESATERIEPEAIPDWLEQLERAVCADDCPTTANLPAEIAGAFPPFRASKIVGAEEGLESAIERRTEAEAIPAWLRRPTCAICANDYSATAADQNDDSRGVLKRLWAHLGRRTAGPQSASPAAKLG